MKLGRLLAGSAPIPRGDNPGDGRLAAGPNETVLIAWDGSDRTITAIQRLVSRATSWHFILAETGRIRPRAEDAASWLEAHGSTAQTVQMLQLEGPAFPAVCQQMRPDYCLANGWCERATNGLAPRSCHAGA